MSKWFIPLVLLYSSTLFGLTSGQCAGSCELCADSTNCLRCPYYSVWSGCFYQYFEFSASERHKACSKHSLTKDNFIGVCGDDCTLCCARSQFSRNSYSSPQCIRRANGVHLAPGTSCWQANDCLQTLTNNIATPAQSCSRISNSLRSSHRTFRDSERDEDENHFSSWGGLVLVVIALVILLAVLKQYCRCVNTQITSQELQEEQEEPITTQTSSDGVPAPVQNANQSEVVVVVAPDGDVDVGLADQH